MKIVDKVLAGFGSSKAKERLHVDTFTDNLKENVEGEKIAQSEDGQLWIHFQELNGYYFMDVVVLSKMSLKSRKRNTLCYISTTKKIELLSDTDETVSDYSNTSKLWLTRISYEVSNLKLEGSEFTLQVKKKLLSFKVIKGAISNK